VPGSRRASGASPGFSARGRRRRHRPGISRHLRRGWRRRRRDHLEAVAARPRLGVGRHGRDFARHGRPIAIRQRRVFPRRRPRLELDLRLHEHEPRAVAPGLDDHLLLTLELGQALGFARFPPLRLRQDHRHQRHGQVDDDREHHALARAQRARDALEIRVAVAEVEVHQ
jgi:hypothetical protein